MRTLYGSLYTLRPYERGIRETLGKYSGFVLPGLGFQILFIHIVRVRDVREHTMDIHPQPVITKDNVEIQVDRCRRDMVTPGSMSSHRAAAGCMTIRTPPQSTRCPKR